MELYFLLLLEWKEIKENSFKMKRVVGGSVFETLQNIGKYFSQRVGDIIELSSQRGVASRNGSYKEDPFVYE